MTPDEEIIDNYIKILTSKLKEASRGEVNTWGFVAMFLDMIEKSKKEYLTKELESRRGNQ